MAPNGPVRRRGAAGRSLNVNLSASLYLSRLSGPPNVPALPPRQERDSFIVILLVRIHLIVEVIWWTGLAPCEFEFSFPGSLMFTSQATYCCMAPEIPWTLTPFYARVFKTLSSYIIIYSVVYDSG